MIVVSLLARNTAPSVAVDWDSPTWGSNPVHVAAYVDAEPGCDQ